VATIRSPANVFRSARLAQPVKLYRIVRAMADRSFVALKYQGKVPAMASCAKFQRKFFTPATFYRDPFGSQEYLLGKYDLHDCPGDPKRRAPLLAWQQTER
jgi:hypothetical protein